MVLKKRSVHSEILSGLLGIGRHEFVHVWYFVVVLYFGGFKVSAQPAKLYTLFRIHFIKFYGYLSSLHIRVRPISWPQMNGVSMHVLE